MHLIAEPILQAHAALGEGSIWDSRMNVLNWVDIDKFQIHTYDPAINKDKFIEVGSQVGTVVKRAPEHGGGFIVGLPDSFAHVDYSGKVTTIVHLVEAPGNRSNDGKCDPAGRFWCGSYNLNEKRGVCNLWMLDLDHTLHHKLGNVSVSNGIVWTADSKIMYYIDSLSGHLDAFDYDVETGNISNRRAAVKNIWGGYFDGMTIDKDDNVYIAIWEGGAVLKIDPRSAHLMAKIEVPGVKNVTSCAFGGPKLTDLYITSSGKKTNPTDEPNAGALFKIELSGTEGCKSFEYKG